MSERWYKLLRGKHGSGKGLKLHVIFKDKVLCAVEGADWVAIHLVLLHDVVADEYFGCNTLDVTKCSLDLDMELEGVRCKNTRDKSLKAVNFEWDGGSYTAYQLKFPGDSLQILMRTKMIQ